MIEDPKKLYWVMKFEKEWQRYQRYMEIAWGENSNAGQKIAARAELPIIKDRMTRFRLNSGSVV